MAEEVAEEVSGGVSCRAGVSRASAGVAGAACLDGAGEPRASVTTAPPPTTRPGPVTVPLLPFVGGRDDFFPPLVVLADPEPSPVTLGLRLHHLYQQWSTRVTQFPDFNPLPAVVLRRQWRSGLAAGGPR